MNFASFKDWLTENALIDTSWEKDNSKLTLKDVLEYLDKTGVKAMYVDPKELKNILIKTKRDEGRVEKANLEYPLIVTQSKGKLISILDGNHRLAKALKNNMEKIKIRILNLNDAPREYKKIFESSVLNEHAYNKDMFIEFGYFNQFLSKPLSISKFKKLVEQAKIEKMSYKLFPKIFMRYDKRFKELLKMQNKSEKELVEWWKPWYLETRNFEKEKQSDEYYYKLVQAIKNDKVDTPIIVLSIDDEGGKNYKFVCGGRNRVILSYIFKKDISAIVINLPEDKKTNIQKIIDKRNVL